MKNPQDDYAKKLYELERAKMNAAAQAHRSMVKGLKIVGGIIVGFFLLVVVVAVLSAKPSKSPEEIASNFAKFQSESTSGPERPYVTSYQLANPKSTLIGGNVSSSWYTLSPELKRSIIVLVWQRWAKINSPEDPKNSPVVLYYGGNSVARATHTIKGEWQVTVEQ